MCEQVGEFYPAILGLRTVSFEGIDYPVTFTGVGLVNEDDPDGEQCATYTIDGHEGKFDLGAVYVPEGKTTEWQLTLEGEETREVPVSGDGFFEVLRKDGAFERYTIVRGMVAKVRTFTVNSAGRTTRFVEPEKFEGFRVRKGDLIRWTATSSDFVLYEFCIKPPYSDKHFMVIPTNFNFDPEADV